jgi:hypothetical protein
MWACSAISAQATTVLPDPDGATRTGGELKGKTAPFRSSSEVAWCTRPMTISVHDRKRLWGLSASRCAFPDCRQELIEETSDALGAFLVGQEAHIVGKAADGPRGQSDLGASERDSYNNLILVCARHHMSSTEARCSLPSSCKSRCRRRTTCG